LGFGKIIGQTEAIEYLRKAMEKDCLSHAYIFYGPEGIGKKLTAFSLAKALNCKKIKYDFCDECLSCYKIDRQTHPDVLLVEPEGKSIKIEQIRRLQERAHFHSFEGGKKVYIIEGAEKMFPAAANSFLKTLEEPPAGTIFILITSAIHQLLPTVLSRCQRLRFKPIPDNLIARVLEQEFGIRNGKANLLASLSMGSLGRALKLVPVLASRKETIDEVLKEDNWPGVFRLAEEFSSGDKDWLYFLEFLLTFFRDAIVFKEKGNFDYIVNKDLEEKIEDFSNTKTMNTLLKSLETLDDTLKALEANANVRLSLENLFLEIFPPN